MQDRTKGIAAMVATCVIWGLSSLYYRLIDEVPPLEVLSHRTLWSALFFGAILLAQGQLGHAFALLARRPRAVALAALMISANWFLFIFSVQSGHTLEASLGYYIFPLVAVALGVLVFRERLSRGQGVAVAMAAGAVAVLTLGLGVAPWIALALAGTFGIYGLVKKRLVAGSMVSVTAEVLLLAPLAIGWLWAVHGGHAAEMGRPGGWFGQSWQVSALLAFSGVLTAVPLMLFSYASQRIGMATLGLVQYLNPTLQFLCAVTVFAQPFTPWHGAAFGLIWAALALYSFEAIRQDRAARSRPASA
ncbi:EamA family transporter RarD [Cereibacter sphaeroides]|uniref:EamA family transporter RarD n=1 Tax=Cereibacter sphaeroides TaxID=1063 RepID=UPI001F376A17|nr:EamA family transporter RarD [Cereibacter sphaeroides]MCE6953206.1 EamA family transporter RarD [Cereibacter sphaeroides]